MYNISIEYSNKRLVIFDKNVYRMRVYVFNYLC